jgi:transcriptional regulator with XRE-family HTH domain
MASPKPAPKPSELLSNLYPPNEVLLNKLTTGLQSQALSMLQSLQMFAEQRPITEQSVWQAHMKAQQALLSALHEARPKEVTHPLIGDSEGTLDPSRAVEFGKSLSQRRMAAKLSRMALSDRAGLSRNTILNIELGKNNPTHATMMRLLSVSELGLAQEDVPWRQLADGELPSAPNCWIAPGYDPIKMFMDLITLLNGQGGSVEQTYAYLDPKSALAWFSLSNQSNYATLYRETIPFGAVAAKILECTGHTRMDVIALGAGDAKDEVRLVRHLLEQHESNPTPGKGRPDISLYLLDISQPLLGEAYRHASATFGGQSGVTVWAVQGNFHHLPRYTQLHYAPQRAHRRRLIAMIGNTLGNLDNEPSFFRHCLIGFAPGDLLLLDVLVAQAPTSDPAEIRRKDPALQGPVRPSHVEWLGGLILRYCNGAVDVKLRLELETNCPAPGSYCLDTMATVRLSDGKEKCFSVHRFKRYESQSLIRILEPLGWEVVTQLPYGPNPASPTKMLLLFRKVHEPQNA